MPILTSYWLTTVKDRYISRAWRHYRDVSPVWRHWWRSLFWPSNMIVIVGLLYFVLHSFEFNFCVIRIDTWSFHVEMLTDDVITNLLISSDRSFLLNSASAWFDSRNHSNMIFFLINSNAKVWNPFVTPCLFPQIWEFKLHSSPQYHAWYSAARYIGVLRVDKWPYSR